MAFKNMKKQKAWIKAKRRAKKQNKPVISVVEKFINKPIRKSWFKRVFEIFN